ncbi:MAG: DNA mismatch repair protein MutL [Chlamydiales bacterium]|jgi:DNA mismatch repair protein MutL
MTSKIKVLDDHTINQIAAGEVIENPSSVIKELIENSLDAGATEITVEIKAGGRQLIRVSDNGYGMNPEDALLCLERHATSKIREVDDLQTISSMGFRGEAIPSIASVSKFTLLTCPREEESNGTMIQVEGGKIIKCSPAARSPGTTIEVNSLFFNIPVRKKFLKSIAADSAEINKLLGILALGNPQVKFELINQEKSILSVTPWPNDSVLDGLGSRIESILGRGFYSALYPIHFEEDGKVITGYFGDPCYTRHNRTGQYLFINSRPVFAPYISASIIEGYGTRLATQRFPVFVLNLSMPGELVDVNVHPQKREVRIQQQYALKDFFISAVQKAFHGKSQKATEETEMDKDSFPWEKDQPMVIPVFAKSGPTEIPPPPQPISNLPWEKEIVTPFFSKASSSLPWEIVTPPKPVSEPLFEDLDQSLLSPPEAEEEALPFFSEPLQDKYRVLSTTNDYILLSKYSDENTFTFLDQRAAHSRVIFEELLKQKTCKESQSLIVPLSLEFSPLESSILEENLETLENLGFGIQSFGKNSFMIDALPKIIEEKDLQSFLTNLIGFFRELETHSAFKKENDKKMALAASRSAIQKNRCLSLKEAEVLVERLMGCDVPDQCPQGKATMVRIDKKEIARKFR